MIITKSLFLIGILVAILLINPANAVVVNPGQSIQAAIDSLPPEGGVVELAAGEHTIPSTILITNRTNIILNIGAEKHQELIH